MLSQRVWLHNITCKEVQKRAQHAESLLLAKFRVSLREYTGDNISTFESKIDGILNVKKQEAEDLRVAEAVAKAKAEAEAVPAPRGLFGSFF